MGRVLHLGRSWHGPNFMWAELAGAKLALGRVVLHTNNRLIKHHYVFCNVTPFIFKSSFIDFSIEERLLREISM